MAFDAQSPYFETPFSSRFISNYVHRTIEADDSDVDLEIENKYHERPGLLSFDLYGTRDYAWVFINMNRDKMTDPIYSLVAGMTISIPTKDRLLGITG